MKYVLFALSIVVLWYRFSGYYQTMPDYRTSPALVTKVTLQEEPELSNRGQKFSIKDSHNQNIFITTVASPQYHTGQVLQIEGKVTVKETEEKRVFFSSSYPKIRLLSESSNGFIAAANILRARSRILYEGVLPPISASLLMGIVFGAKEQFPDDFLAALRNTGVMHIVAASGMNIAFVAAACILVFGKVMRRQYAIAAASLGVLFYVFMVGMQPSIIRAAIMGMLAFGAALTGRQQFAVWSVFLSGYVMLLYQPGYLFDLGFQLSFLATLGIICLQPLFSFPKTLFFDILTTTLAAQIATFPLLIAVFGTFGIYSLAVNMLILWTIPLVMTLGAAAAAIGIVCAAAAHFLILLSLPLLLYVEWIIALFGSLGGVIMLPRIPWPFLWAYYLFLTAIVLHKKTWKGKVGEMKDEG